MFILTQYLLKNFLYTNISDNSLSTYTVVIGLVIYALFYSYFLMYNRELLPFFNKIIIYVIGVDLLISAFYNYNIQLQNTHLNDNPSIQHLENLNNIEYNLINHNENDIIYSDEDDQSDQDDEDDQSDQDNEDDQSNQDDDDDEDEDDIENEESNDELIDEKNNNCDNIETFEEKKNETILSNDTTMIDLNNHNLNESLNQNLNDINSINDVSSVNDVNSVNDSVNTIFTKQISEHIIKKRGRPAKNKI